MAYSRDDLLTEIQETVSNFLLNELEFLDVSDYYFGSFEDEEEQDEYVQAIYDYSLAELDVVYQRWEDLFE